MHLQTRRLDGQSYDTNINGAILQFLNDLVAKVAIDADLNAGIKASVFGEHLRQDIEAGSFVRADQERAARRNVLVRYREQGLIAHPQEPLCVGEQDSAGGGKPHRLSRTVEEFVAVLLFEEPDLAADGGLRAENFLASMGETAKLGDLQKRKQLIKVHS
jgi:hypothetical protein